MTSIYKRQQPNEQYVVSGRALKHRIARRYRRIENFLHQFSSLFVQYCLEHNIDTIVVGYNRGWKQEISIGKRNNQNFVNVPFLNLLKKIEYKAEDRGIRVEITEEGYNSKCSFLDNEVIEKHSKYKGKRVSRGVFRASCGRLINADCNGAANIGRKVFPMLFNYRIVDVVNHPII